MNFTKIKTSHYYDPLKLIKLASVFCAIMLIFQLSLSATAVAPAHQTFYVDVGAAEGGNGSESSPFCSIYEAMETINEGIAFGFYSGEVDVIFAEGTYPITSTVVFTNGDSGNEKFSVNYKAAKDCEVIFTGATETPDGAVSVLSGSLINVKKGAGLSFEGITFTDNLNAPLMQISGENITVKNCTFSNSGYTKSPSDKKNGYALSVTGTGVRVTSCEFFNTDGGIYVSGGEKSTLTPSENIVSNCLLHDLSGTAIYAAGIANTVVHNEISSVKNAAVITGNSNTVSYNHITDCSKNGISVVGGVTCLGNELRYNFVDTAGKNGISLEDGVSAADVFGNMINNAEVGIYLGGGRNINVENNVIIHAGNTSFSPTAILYDDTIRSSVLSDSNRYKTTANAIASVITDRWSEVYPYLSKINIPPSLTETINLNDPSLFFNPSETVIRNNAFYAGGKTDSLSLTLEGDTVNGVEYQKRYGLIYENVLMPRGSLTDFPAAEFGNYTLKANAKLFDYLPDFKKIDYYDLGIPGITTAPFPFDDVADTSWYFKWVVYVSEHGLMKGTDTSGTLFSPNVTTSRAMIVQILYNLEGCPEVQYTDKFTDVKESAWYADAVIWAEANGITSGTSENTFSPSTEVTREQLAVFLFRYLRDYKKLDIAETPPLDTFPDVSEISPYKDFKEALEWAVGEWIITGKSTAGRLTLSPGDTAQRCEAAAMFARFCLGCGM